MQMYSAYPARFARKSSSSSKSRHAKPAMKSGTKRSPHQEPSASGIPIKTRMAPAYMGVQLAEGQTVVSTGPYAIVRQTNGDLEFATFVSAFPRAKEIVGACNGV